METLLRLFPVLCLALLGATSADDTQRQRVVAFAVDGFEPAVNERSAIGGTQEAILQRFGTPDLVGSATQWEGDGLFETKYWYYEGLEIRISRPVGASETWFRKIILESPAYKLKFGLSIGTRKSEFLKELGPPDAHLKPTSHSLVYTVSNSRNNQGVTFGGHAGVEIFFDEQDRAEKIVWDYYAD